MLKNALKCLIEAGIEEAYQFIASYYKPIAFYISVTVVLCIVSAFEDFIHLKPLLVTSFK